MTCWRSSFKVDATFSALKPLSCNLIAASFRPCCTPCCKPFCNPCCKPFCTPCCNPSCNPCSRSCLMTSTNFSANISTPSRCSARYCS
ncbi:MAG TPA: hypothetical protein EYH46_04900, partial [Sulfurivirga caldicuralii]|nr:hypothetical protein [Sulfurivirga caldicuralii]